MAGRHGLDLGTISQGEVQEREGKQSWTHVMFPNTSAEFTKAERSRRQAHLVRDHQLTDLDLGLS